MLVIADTSPLNYLVWIGHVELLPKLYDRALIPSAVRSELLAPEAPDAVRLWVRNLPGWAEIVDPEPELLEEPAWKDLGEGERAALALASTRQPIFLLIDEWAARTLAEHRGFLVTGTLGVLDQAARRNLISFAEAIEKLQKTSFRYPRALVERLLEEHQQRQKGL